MRVSEMLKTDVRELLFPSLKAARESNLVNRPNPTVNSAFSATAIINSWLKSNRVTSWADIVPAPELNSIVAISDNYIAQRGTEPPLIIQQWTAERGGGGQWEAWNDYKDTNDTLPGLLANPCPMLGIAPLTLLGVTFIDVSRGNAYWLIVSDEQGRPRQLWPIRREWVSSVSLGKNPQSGLTEIRYSVAWPWGETKEYSQSEIVHFRLPVADSGNSLMGRDPLTAQLPYIAADDESAQYAYSILKNQGIMPYYMTAKNTDQPLTPEAKKALRLSVEERTTGVNRGKMPILDGDMEIKELGTTPEKMALDKLTDPPEERIPAARGLNAMALQLGAGLARSTFSNMGEATSAAWDNGIAPLHTIVASAINHRLAPLFAKVPGHPAKVRVFFDYGMVASLQEDENAMHARERENFKTGALRTNDFLRATRREPLPDSDPRGDMNYFELQSAAMGGGAMFGPPVEPEPKAEPTKAAAPRGIELKRAAPTDSQASAVVDFLARCKGDTARARSASALALGKSAEFDLLDATLKLQRGDISASAWEKMARPAMETIHRAQAVIGYGGIDEMTDARWQWAQDRIDFQSGYFDGFVSDVNAGRYEKPDGGEPGDELTPGLANRATQYADASHATFENASLQKDKDDGMTWGRRVMADVEHCESCEAEAAKGAQPIDELSPLGDDVCKSNCSCIIITGTEKGDVE